MLKTILETAGIAVNTQVVEQIDANEFLKDAQLYEDDGIVAYDTYLLTARYLDALLKAKSREKLFVGKYSREYILSLYYYNPATGIFTNRKTGHVMGSQTKNQDHYLKLHIDQKSYLAHRIAYFIMTGRDPDLLVDHKDGNRYNNSITNLRLATHSQNGQNRRHTKPNGSGSLIPGVTYFKRFQKWRVMLRKNNRLQFFGYFSTQSEAEAYCLKVRRDFYEYNTI